ncbi:MAG: hypothetical protein AAF141_05845 [Pseudomonadota bacterium]
MSNASLERELGRLSGKLDALGEGMSRIEKKFDDNALRQDTRVSALDARVQAVESYQKTDKVINNRSDAKRGLIIGAVATVVVGVFQAAFTWFRGAGP